MVLLTIPQTSLIEKYLIESHAHLFKQIKGLFLLTACIISSIYVSMNFISVSSMSTLVWNFYPEAQMPVGRPLYFNSPNSVTIVDIS